MRRGGVVVAVVPVVGAAAGGGGGARAAVRPVGRAFFIDDYSKFTWIYLHCHKSEVFQRFHDF
jgi:hypothetical protein